MTDILKPNPVAGDMEWFVHDRFGMFIHWGTYALAARHEWVKNHERMDDAAYRKYFTYFDPDLYDPAAWARAARKAGMKYVVLTTKHHEGFCLWDSAYTDYKVTNTPYGKDALLPFVDAFRAEGLKVGFYYSLIDWHHPDFPIDGIHPLRDHPDAVEMNKSRDIGKYREYLHNQVRELLTDFGKIDILWFDFSYPTNEHRGMRGKGHEDWGSDELLTMIRELQPGIIVNNRLNLPADRADIHTPEQYQPTEWVKVDGKRVYWETCQTFSGSWGYYRDEMTWKSPEQLIRMLVNSVSCGGNLLMNVGPTARGAFDDRACKALQVYEHWMRLHSRSIYGCTQSEFDAPADCRFTQNGKRLYLHIFAWPFRAIHLPGFAGKVDYAQLLNDASEVLMKETEEDVHANMVETTGCGTLTLELPVTKPDVTVPVVELFLK
ncbi:MAG: alpha-L-fucosidase [Candidatus Pacebacteria bacterium]|nr:alpha-L-fucosidase [Candidatus Paceibacterota bacterium]